MDSMTDRERAERLNSARTDIEQSQLELLWDLGNPFHAETMLKRAKANIDAVLNDIKVKMKVE